LAIRGSDCFVVLELPDAVKGGNQVGINIHYSWKGECLL